MFKEIIMTRRTGDKKKALAEIIQQIRHHALNVKAWTKEVAPSQRFLEEKQILAVAMAIQLMGKQAKMLFSLWPDMVAQDSIKMWKALRRFCHHISHSFEDINSSDLYRAGEEADFFITWADSIAARLFDIAKQEEQAKDPRKVFPDNMLSFNQLFHSGR